MAPTKQRRAESVPEMQVTVLELRKEQRVEEQEMIETILCGIPLLAMALGIAFIVIVVTIGCMFGIEWLWGRNRVLGISATVTCIVVAVLISSYLIGSAVG